MNAGALVTTDQGTSTLLTARQIISISKACSFLGSQCIITKTNLDTITKMSLLGANSSLERLRQKVAMTGQLNCY